MLSFALTIFTGAFLLFQIQPLIGKYILPWFGGTPGVWTTCLLFFQLLLLGGYAYAHFSTSRLKPRTQVKVHLGLMLLSLALLPITPSESWKAHVAGNPTLHVLLVLTVSIGLPYFVLSATGPLLQQWFSQTNPGVSPYRLYALSNIGSLLALLSFPTFFEVRFTRQENGILWSGGLGLFVLCCGFCARKVWKVGVPVPAAGVDPGGTQSDPDGAARTSLMDRCLWLFLPAIASALLLATTNKLTQEVAVIPFLWVLPLALYLLTFIICFDHERWYSRNAYGLLLIVGAAVVYHLLVGGTSVPIFLQVPAFAAALFVACMFCHGELFLLRPAPARLTSYYLHISAGGALGGVLVAVVAPAVFSDFRELQIIWWLLILALGAISVRHRSRAVAVSAAVGALAATLVGPWLRPYYINGSPGYLGELEHFYSKQIWWVLAALAIFVACMIDARRFRPLREWRPRVAGFIMLLSSGAAALFLWQMKPKDEQDVRIIHSSRNFYGTLKVYDYNPDDSARNYHQLVHGATTHGLQFTAPAKSRLATTYYGEPSGVGLAIAALPTPPGERRFGFVGLGTGTLATYGKAGDTVRIYDINPAVRELSQSGMFTYVSGSPAKVDIIMGDARLSMEHELAVGQSQQFDLLALDAFSSDAIPVHLLTREAFGLYVRQLKPGGVIAVHISNRYLNLEPVVATLALEFGMRAVTVSDSFHLDWWVYSTTWVLVTRNAELLDDPAIRAAGEPASDEHVPLLWTDDHVSLFQILIFPKRKDD